MDDDGIIALCSGIEETRNLKTLSLNGKSLVFNWYSFIQWNNDTDSIGDSGIAAISSMIQKNNNLLTLNLSLWFFLLSFFAVFMLSEFYSMQYE